MSCKPFSKSRLFTNVWPLSLNNLLVPSVGQLCKKLSLAWKVHHQTEWIETLQHPMIHWVSQQTTISRKPSNKNNRLDRVNRINTFSCKTDKSWQLLNNNINYTLNKDATKNFKFVYRKCKICESESQNILWIVKDLNKNQINNISKIKVP